MHCLDYYDQFCFPRQLIVTISAQCHRQFDENEFMKKVEAEITGAETSGKGLYCASNKCWVSSACSLDRLENLNIILLCCLPWYGVVMKRFICSCPWPEDNLSLHIQLVPMHRLHVHILNSLLPVPQGRLRCVCNHLWRCVIYGHC